MKFPVTVVEDRRLLIIYQFFFYICFENSCILMITIFTISYIEDCISCHEIRSSTTP